MSQQYVILPPGLVPGLLAILDECGMDLGHGHVVILTGGLHKLRAIRTGRDYQLASGSTGHSIWVESRSYPVVQDHPLSREQVRVMVVTAGVKTSIAPSGTRGRVSWWWMSSVLAKIAADTAEHKRST